MIMDIAYAPPTTAPPLNGELQQLQRWTCKYTAEHGEFKSPRSLGQHYAAEHPEHTPSPGNTERVVCQCGRTFLVASRPDHMRRFHRDVPRQLWPTMTRPVDAEPTPRRQYKPRRTQLPNGRRRCTCGQELTNNNSAQKHVKRMHPEHLHEWTEYAPLITGALVPAPRHEQRHEAHEAEVVAWGPDDVDNIVLPVIGNLVGHDGSVPYNKLETLLRWRDQTRAMLHDMTEP